MRKAILCLGGVILSANLAIAGAFEDNLTKLIEDETGTKIKIVRQESLKSSKDLKFVLIEISDNAQRIPLFATKDGKMIVGLSNIFLTSNKSDDELVKKLADEVMAHNENSQSIAAGALIEQLKPEQYITLKSSDKNSSKTKFIVADPNCGYCKEEFRKIDEHLKTHNVNIVMVGILGEDSLKKAANAVSKINSAMSEKQKLNGLKEVFSNSYKAPKTIDTSTVQSTTDFLFKSGAIRGVPYIYEVK